MLSLTQKALVLLLAPLLLIACMSKGGATAGAISERERAAIEQLAWVDVAIAQVDAQAAIAENNTHLLSMGGRGGTLPGVAVGESAQLAERCGVTILTGATDTVLGDQHLTYLQRARDYAEQYNTLVLTHCKAN